MDELDQSELNGILDSAQKLHEDMDMDALLLASDDPMHQILPSTYPAGAGRKENMKVLSFVKEPALAMPILQIVKAKGFKETLGHHSKTKFLALMKRKCFPLALLCMASIPPQTSLLGG